MKVAVLKDSFKRDGKQFNCAICVFYDNGKGLKWYNYDHKKWLSCDLSYNRFISRWGDYYYTVNNIDDHDIEKLLFVMLL